MSRWSKNVRNRRDDALSRVDWRDFERLLADYYRRQGYRVEHCGTGANASRFDGGIDLKLYRGDAYLVVQCKHWNARQVPHNAMHELLGIMHTEGANGAILVTSGEFTPRAVEAGANAPAMQLIDGDALRGMLGPLPEPRSVVHAPEDRAARMVAEVGERLFRAAEDRIRYGGRGRPSRAATIFIWLPLAKLALMVLITGAIIALLSTILSPANLLRTVQPAAHTAQATTVTQPVASPPAPSPRAQSRPPADQYVVGMPPPPQTEAEIREQQRLADEAMRVLAPNTLEMDMGHADDPRANDYYDAPKNTSGQSAGWGR